MTINAVHHIDSRLGTSLENQLLQAVDQAIIATELDGKIIYWNAPAERMFGWGTDEVLGRNILEVTPSSQTLDEATSIMEALQKGERWRGEIVLQRKGGEVFPAHVTNSPVEDDTGALIAIVGVSIDMSDRWEADQHKMLLLAEYRHRIKNTLANVESLADQTFRAYGDQPERFKETFSERLRALGAAQNLLSWEATERASLYAVVSEALKPFRQADGDRIQLSGPEVLVDPANVVSLVLAFHELATNAVKYGALSAPNGLVVVAWTESDGEVELTWNETGGPPVSRPARKGFGSRLLEQAIARQLAATVTLAYPPEGVCCSIRARL
jgi:two-component system, chemotaxis family, CheB/CheR fusion protein